MIKTANSIDATQTLRGIGYDTAPSDSTNNTVLSAVYIPKNTLTNISTIRVKALFRKGTANSTVYDTSLVISTGITLSNFVLGRVTIQGSTTVASLQRNVFFYLGVVFPPSSLPIYYYGDYTIDKSVSSENDFILNANIGLNEYSVTSSPSAVFNEDLYILACAQRITTAGVSFDSITCSYLYVDI